jgi:hypothetical protein
LLYFARRARRLGVAHSKRKKDSALVMLVTVDILNQVLNFLLAFFIISKEVM